MLTKEQTQALEEALDEMAAAKKELQAAKGKPEERDAQRQLLTALDNVNTVIKTITGNDLNNN